jgi:hypothetical protein
VGMPHRVRMDQISRDIVLIRFRRNEGGCPSRTRMWRSPVDRGSSRFMQAVCNVFFLKCRVRVRDVSRPMIASKLRHKALLMRSLIRDPRRFQKKNK